MVKEKEEEELFYNIALTRTGQIGGRLARHLLQYFENAREIFHVPVKRLEAVEGIGLKKIQALRQTIDEAMIRKEISFIRTHAIRPLFITDPGYPSRLRLCPDAPVMLYYKGNQDLNQSRVISIVGTRKNTDYGAQLTESLIEGLAGQDILIVSGLAFGIDIIAHRKALRCGIPTVGVMAHGMDRIYPQQHKHIAKEMAARGGLLTEYPSGTLPDKYNFPMRNRIVAGMCDLTVVVETEVRGGAMITAKLALGYNREVAAFPGRVSDKKSDGCNYLIRTQAAQLITGAADLLDMMNWQPPEEKHAVQQRLFGVLSPEESRVVDILAQSGEMHIDAIGPKTGIHATHLSALLLGLELHGHIRSLPGKRYRLG